MTEYLLVTVDGRYGPMDERAAIARCLSGAVAPDAFVEDSIPGGRRQYDLSRFPRLHRAALLGQAQPGSLAFAECPVCAAELFQPTKTDFHCDTCKTTFALDAAGQTKDIKRPTPMASYVLLGIFGITSIARIGVIGMPDYKGILEPVSYLTLSLAMFAAIFLGLRRKVYPWHRNDIAFRRQPVLFVAWTLMLGGFAIVGAFSFYYVTWMLPQSK